MQQPVMQTLRNIYRGEARAAIERKQPIRKIINVAIPTALIFSLLNYLAGFIALALVELLVVLLLLLPVYPMLRREQLENVCENMLMAAAVTIFLALLVTGGKGGAGSNWIFIYPFLAFYINAQQKAWNWILFFFLAMVLHIVLAEQAVIGTFYTVEQLRLYLITFLFYTFIAYIFNSLRNHYERQLEQRVDEQTSEIRRSMEELERKALYDDLTGLPNRYLFEDRLSQAIRVAERETDQLAVVVINLSRFQEVNNILGHDKGDEVLNQMGERLARLLRASDTAARIGGDTFALILPGASVKTANIVTRKVFLAMDDPFVIDGYAIELTLNIGVAIAPVHANKADQLLQKADLAMRQAKQQQLGMAVLYDQEQDPYSFRRLALYGKLRKAIERDELALVYQPKVDLATGRLAGVEALLRWHDAEEGFVPPDEFIPIAEQTGLINRVSEWVMARAVEQTAAWKAEGLDIPMSINLSPRNLLNSLLPGQVDELIRKHGLKHSDLCIEVTETALMTNPATALFVLTRLHDMQVALSIDDFGTGYSSLSYIKSLPVDELKIDRCFIMSMDSNPTDAMIVKSTVELAHGLGLSVVAEGVENEAVLQMLKSDGVDKVQGYYYSKPLPPSELTGWCAEPGAS